MVFRLGSLSKGKHQTTGDFSRVSCIIHGGEIQILEANKVGPGHGIGGLLLTTVPFENSTQASEFQAAFVDALKNFLPADPAEYEGSKKTRNAIVSAAADTHAKLSGGME